eukprot:scaffold6620_cov110-Isochrysis_galbana.AAC.3
MKYITAHTADRTSAPSLLHLSLPHPLHPFVSSAFLASASFCAADPPPAPATRGAGTEAASPDAASLHAADGAIRMLARRGGHASCKQRPFFVMSW